MNKPTQPDRCPKCDSPWVESIGMFDCYSGYGLLGIGDFCQDHQTCVKRERDKLLIERDQLRAEVERLKTEIKPSPGYFQAIEDVRGWLSIKVFSGGDCMTTPIDCLENLKLISDCPDSFLKAVTGL